MRLGLLYPSLDPVGPREWSGTPAGLAAGFATIGVEVVPIGSAMPGGLRQLVGAMSHATGKRGAVADRVHVKNAARTWAIGRNIHAAGPIDAILAMGTELYDLGAVVPPGVVSSTYDDGTLAQMWAHENSDLRLAGFPPSHVSRWIARQRRSTAAADMNFVSTHWAKESFLDDYRAEESSVKVVGMGHRPRTGTGNNRDWSRPNYLFVGVDWRRKNGERILEAFARVHARIPQATLHLVGSVPGVRQEGVSVHGHLARDDGAAQEKLLNLFSTATCFVLPGLFDPSPIACLEAASAGVPVIASTEGGAGEFLGEGAALVDPANVAAIEAAMLRFSDPAEARRCGGIAELAASGFTWSAVAGRIGQALSESIVPAKLKDDGVAHV